MIESRIHSKPNVERAITIVTKFTFMGCSFIKSVSELEEKGGNYTISLLKTELQQVMSQIYYEKTKDIPKYLIIICNV